jgi:ABC-type glycerol-3-phosphate transport system permease component
MLGARMGIGVKRGNRIKSGTPFDRVLDALICVVFGAFAFICVYPFYYIFINTISNNKLSSQGAVLWYPKQIHFDNYKAALRIPSLGQAALVSVSRTVLVTALVVVISAFMAFMFTRDTLWKRKFWFRFVMITMYFNAGIIPWYLTMMNLRLTNNFLGYVLPGLVAPFYILLMKTYIEGLSKSLQEAAEIDGAGVLTVFSRVILPVSTPILSTIAIFSAVNQWNAFQDTLLLMTNEKLFTLQFVLYRYLQSSSSLASIVTSSSAAAGQMAANAQTQTSIRMTVTIIVALPILVVYPFFQRYFVKGIMIGAVKG